MVKFLDNKYTKIYYQLMNKGQLRENLEIGEKHHIIPKSLGGSNDKNNIVLLTFREHFLAHLLLTKMVEFPKEKKSMVYAFLGMKHRVKNNKLYEQVKEKNRSFFTGKNAPHYGRKHSEETKKLISNIHKGKKLSEQHKELMRKKQLGKKHTEEYKENMRNRFSKKWLVIDPRGNKIEVMNLNQYCRDNSLNSAHMNSVANGLRPHHKKYRVERA